MNHDSSKCSWTRDHIDVYLDGDLDPHDVHLFESHLDVCDGCREEVVIARRLVAELHSLPELHCPDSVVDAVFDETGVTDRNAGGATQRWLDRVRGFARRPVLAPAFAGAFVLLVVASAVLVGEMTKRPHYSDEEIQAAEAQLKWALGYVGKVSHDAALTVRDDVLNERVARPVSNAASTTVKKSNPATNSNGGN